MRRGNQRWNRRGKCDNLHCNMDFLASDSRGGKVNARRSRKIEPTAQAPPCLQLRLLGTMVVGGADAAIALPRSRKTRALLAYLALSQRPVRRERLCEIFWDLPDDPRAALRWSLSKLRGVVDTPECRRLIADRDTVALDRRSIDIDALRLKEASERPQDWPTQELTHLVGLGEFLEGQDLKGAVEFQSWLAGERATLQRARQNLLRHLLARHEDEPETALEFARSLV